MEKPSNIMHTDTFNSGLFLALFWHNAHADAINGSDRTYCSPKLGCTGNLLC